MLDQELAGAGVGEVSGDGQESEYDNDPDIPLPSPYLPTLVEIKSKVLSKAEGHKHLEEKIKRVSTVFLLSRSEAAILLHHFKWSVSRTEDEWLSCEEKIRKAVGLFERPIVETPVLAERTCGICHEKFPGEIMLGISCGHQFCRSWWAGYIS